MKKVSRLAMIYVALKHGISTTIKLYKNLSTQKANYGDQYIFKHTLQIKFIDD